MIDHFVILLAFGSGALPVTFLLFKFFAPCVVYATVLFVNELSLAFDDDLLPDMEALFYSEF